MTSKPTITFRIPEPLLSSTLRAARAEEMTTSEFIRAAVAAHVAQFDQMENCDDAITSMRRTLRRDFAEAKSWVDLQRRLRDKKFVLRQVDNELCLMTWPVEHKLEPISRLGIKAEELTVLYRAPFPAHSPKTKAKRMPYLLMNPVSQEAA